MVRRKGMYVTNETYHHLLIPLAYNRVLKQRKRGAVAHWAETEVEIHRIALYFPMRYFTIPAVHELVDSRSYIMDAIFDAEGVFQSMVDYNHPLHLWEELVAFREYIIHEGYYPHAFTVVITHGRPKLFDFSNFGQIEKGIVRFPNGDKMTLEQALVERPLLHRAASYVTKTSRYRVSCG